MKCPHCDSQLGYDATACPACGFDATASSERHGNHWVRLERLTDAAHCLRLADRRRLEVLLDDFERRFPQVFVAVYFGVLPTGLTVAETGFWLLNHAAFGTHEVMKRNEFGIALVVDPASGTAGFTVGYAIEALGSKFAPTTILDRMQRHLAVSDYGEAVATAVHHLESQFMRLGCRRERDSTASRFYVVSDDLGLRPLRTSSATKSQTAAPSQFTYPQRS